MTASATSNCSFAVSISNRFDHLASRPSINDHGCGVFFCFLASSESGLLLIAILSNVVR